ncbi:MAG: radical SAM protein [Phycisphaerae bacterium]|jgi:radical SAM protein with 4Fe4S-binding SPASM domain
MGQHSGRPSDHEAPDRPTARTVPLSEVGPEAETGRPSVGGSRTAPPTHSTAFRLGKQYHEQWPVSTNPDKRADRPDDGHITSLDYLRSSETLRQMAGKGDGAAGVRFDLDYHHWLERVLGQWWMRGVLRMLTRSRRGRATLLEEVITSYGNPQATWRQRILFWPFHLLIRRLKGQTPVETFRRRVAEHSSTVRGLVLTARSVAEFGITVPQRFSAPMFMVWNFTNQCNLRCKHCYQDTAHRRLSDELTLEEKLDLVDQAGRLYVPMIAFAGGEPTIDCDLLTVLKRCQQWGIHTSLATHGGTMTPKLAGQLAEAGVKYVEVSLDSVHAERHDAFRGQPGMWERTVRGMRNVVAQEGLRLGVAMCVHRSNVDELDDMIRFAVDIGASTFAHFNFIPVGRGLEMSGEDLDPQQRERVLRTLNEWMQSGRIGVLSTAPQLGRVCLAHAPVEGRTAASHAGSGAGWKARVVAKYLGGCGAGRCYVAVEPNGDITPCVYLPHRVLGNIRQRRLSEMFRDNPFWEIACDRTRRLGHCEVCAFKHYCGGCLARSDAYYGVLNAGDPGCLFNARHWEDIVAQQAAGAETLVAPETAEATR